MRRCDGWPHERMLCICKQPLPSARINAGLTRELQRISSAQILAYHTPLSTPNFLPSIQISSGGESLWRFAPCRKHLRMELPYSRQRTGCWHDHELSPPPSRQQQGLLLARTGRAQQLRLPATHPRDFLVRRAECHSPVFLLRTLECVGNARLLRHCLRV